MSDKKSEMITDELLIRQVHEGSSASLDMLLDRYKGFVRRIAHGYYLVGGDQDDLIQEGMIGLMRSIMTFQAEEGRTFKPYALTCVTRQIHSVLRTSMRDKNIPLNTYVSLDMPPAGAASELTYEEIIPADTADPEQQIVSREEYSRVLTLVHSRLSKMEREVMDMYLAGMGYDQIAQQLGKDAKAVDNALQRARKKAVQVLG